MSFRNTAASLAVLVGLATSITPAVSATQAEIFYRNNVGPWTVLGKGPTDKLSPICSMQYNFRDGSYALFIKDLNDDEIYMLFSNVQWQIIDKPGKYDGIRLNFYTSNGVEGDNIDYELLSKNTIRLRNLNSRFIELFAIGNKIELIMPGNIENAQMPLTGTRAAISAMVECTKSAPKFGSSPGSNPAIDLSKPSRDA